MAFHDITSEDWDNIAVGYDRFVTPTHIELGNEALRLVDLRPGNRFLDVAAGSGALSIPAAHIGAQVVATDISPLMIERLQSRVHEKGLANVETHIMDGHALDFDDDSFDVAGSQYGVMLFPDLPRALREMVRVVRPGGRVTLVVFGPFEEMEFLTFFIKAARTAVPGFTGLPTDPPPLPFQVADPDKLRQAFVRAGLEEVRVERTVEYLEFSSGEEMWDWLLNSNPIAVMMIADFTEAQRDAVKEELDRLLREVAEGDNPAVLTNSINIGIGTK